MRRIFVTAALLFVSTGHLRAEDAFATGSAAAEIHLDFAYRIVAIAACLYSCRVVWYGLVERKITAFRADVLDWLLDWSPRQVIHRDAAPVRYWILMGVQTITMVVCFVAAIIGWQPNT